MAFFFRQIDKEIAACQREMMETHYQEVETMYRQMRGWRHDYRSHIQALKALAAEGDVEAVKEYLDQLDTDLNSVDTVVKTGNLMADAILNSKLSLAKAKGIRVSAAASIPKESSIPDVSLCTILGNLLDNAMEACLRLTDPEARFLRVYISPMKGQLYLSVTNSAPGKARQENGKFLSAKPNRDPRARHGFGLSQIDRMVKYLGGYVNRQQEEDVFATEVMIPF